MRLGFLGALVCLPLVAAALPNELNQEGLVFDAQGAPYEGRHSVRVRLYDGPAGGAALFDELHAGVEFFEGYYAIAVGSVEALPPELMTRPRVYMGVSIDGGAELSPRHPLRKVPAAFSADVAVDVTGDIHPTSITVGNTLIVNSDGEWVGPAAGLVGPRGPEGPEGPQGPAGPAGGNGSPDTPQQVRDKLVQVDGRGSGVDADRFDGLDSTAFPKTPADINALLRQADGAGSGVDADRLDGLDSTQFVRTPAQIRDGLRTVDGAGSGVDADRLDGFDSSEFIRTAAQILAALITVDGAGSGLDADRLDGLDSTQLLRVGGDAELGDLTVNGTFALGSTLQLRRANSDPVACSAATAGQVYFNTDTDTFMGCDGDAWVALNGGAGGGDGFGKRIVIVEGARRWSDGTSARSCKAYLEDPDFGDGRDGLYWLDTGRNRFKAYCDMTTAGGGWTVAGHYRYPGYTNAPADIDNRDYAYYMRSRSRQAYGREGYYGDPDSPGPWMDWRILDGIGFPAEMTVILDMNDFSSGWENYGRKVIYRIKTAKQLPNYGTSQDLTTGDNLYWKLNPGDAWSDVGANTSSGTYYWYTRHPNNNYLVLLHVSNYRYLDGRGATNHRHSAYWGAGMGGNNTWHHSAKILIRETAPPAAAEANEVWIAEGADGVRTWADNSLSATCKQYRNPPAGKAYRGDIGSGFYRLQTPVGNIKAYCDMHSDGGGWTLVAYNRHPGYTNAPAGHDNRDYHLYMRARSNVAIGNAAYIGDPNSAGPWADWRLLSGLNFPLEMAVLLSRGIPYRGDFSGTSAKVIYRVKNRNVMPNATTSQDLTSGDNLYYKLNPGNNWTDVGTSSASGIYYWYPRASNNNYLTLLHESNYFYLGDRARGRTNYHYSFYYGSGMGGPNNWHYSGHMFVRELD